MKSAEAVLLSDSFTILVGIQLEEIIILTCLSYLDTISNPLFVFTRVNIILLFLLKTYIVGTC